MSVADRRRTDMPTSLSINQSSSTTSKSKSKHQTNSSPSENWDDSSSDTETELEPGSALPTGVSTGSSAPPPTPLTPSNAAGGSPFDSPYAISALTGPPLTPMRGNFRPDSHSSSAGDSYGLGSEDQKRPEKSTATAARLIASGLGVRAPKKSEEMKRYEKAARDKEERRVHDQREEVRRTEEAKRSAWED